MLKCNICMEPIYIFYYTRYTNKNIINPDYSNKCNCKLYFHIDCILEWYKYSRKCIICNKVDLKTNQEIRKQYNKSMELFILFISSLVSLFSFYFIL